MSGYLAKFRPTMIVEVSNSTAGNEVNELMAGLNCRHWDINDAPRNGPPGIRHEELIKEAYAGAC